MRPASEQDLFARFDALGIAHRTTRHRPVFTVAESRDLKSVIPGGHTKNLFLKDKKGALFLLCALAESVIDLNAVSKLIGAGRFSFGNAALLMGHLGVEPGSPVFLFERTSRVRSGGVAEFVRSTYRGDRYRIVVDIFPPDHAS